MLFNTKVTKFATFFGLIRTKGSVAPLAEIIDNLLWRRIHPRSYSELITGAASNNNKKMRILGTGSAIPKLEVTNDDLTKFLDTSDEWISTRTGIKSRHILSEGETLTDLAAEATRQALADAKVDAKDLDYIICHNIMNDRCIPGMGCIIQGIIGATCPCIDTNAACTGFIYALDHADALMKAGKANKILIICAEQMSMMIDWERRESCVLFGDGAGAVVVSNEGEDCAVKVTACYTPALNCNVKQGDTPFRKDATTYDKLEMAGREVFKLAAHNSCNDIQTVLDASHATASDVKFFILHQANLRIVEAIRSFLDQPEEKFPHNIEHRGNTSSASVLLLLDELNKAGKIQRGDTIVFSAFGAGFTSGACLMKW